MSYTKKLSSLRAFVPYKKYIIDIVKFCRLKHTSDWRIWVDDYGNKLSVNRIQQPSIIINKNINPQTLELTDLYAKAHIKKLSSINKYSLISIRKNFYYLWMIDENNILRLCWYKDDILMENPAVLISGINNLKIIIETLDVELFKVVNSIVDPLDKNILMDFSWATSWPPHEDLLVLLPNVIQKDCNLVKR